MPLEATCPACGRDLRLRDELAGKRVRCPECRTPFDVPDRPARVARDPGRASGGSPVLVIALVAGGLALLAGLGVSGYLAYRALSSPPAGGGGPAPGVEIPSRLSARPDVVALDVPPAEVVGVLVPTARPGQPVVLVDRSRHPGGVATRADTFDVRTGKRLGSVGLEGRVTGLLKDVSPDGDLLAIQDGPGAPLLRILSLAPGGDAGAKGRPQTFPARNLFFLDRSRWLVLKSDESMEVWTAPFGEAQRRRVRPPRPGPQPPVQRDFEAISPDRKTLVVWTGRTFDLFDAGTGAGLGRTGFLNPGPGEIQTNLAGFAFSPDGSRLMGWSEGELGGEPGVVSWEARHSAPPRRWKVDGVRGARWWGNKHVLAVVAQDPDFRAKLYQADTGNHLCDVLVPCFQPAVRGEDGHLWFVAARAPGGAAVLGRLAFPEAEVMRVLDSLPPGRELELEVKADAVAVK